MREFVIMTDSCCDLNAAEVRELNVQVLPLSYTLEGETLLNTADHSELAPEEFYRRLKAGAECTTAAVNVGEFTEAMASVLASGKDLLYIAFSSAMSTTYQSACIAAEDLRAAHPEAKIIVVDSLAASRGQGLMVYYAAKKAQEGASLEETAEYVRGLIPHLCHWFTVDDLNHLKRGGRVSPTAALMGTMLNIKPVLHVDDAGRLIPMGKVRGRKASVAALADAMERLGTPPLADQTVFICHGDCQEDVDYLSSLLRERFGVTDIRSDYTGPVIGAHSGCGTLAIFFLGREK